LHSNDDPTNSNEKTIEHISDKIQLHQLIPISHQATLSEAYHLLINQRCGGVYIYQENINDMIGIVTFEQIRHYLVTGKLIAGKTVQVEQYSCSINSTHTNTSKEN
jgi:predicted transcriptional regulator